MSDWTGFTDADLKKLKSADQKNAKLNNRPKIAKPIKKANLQTNKQNLAKQRQVKKQIHNQNENSDTEVSSKALLSPQTPPSTPPDQGALHGKTTDAEENTKKQKNKEEKELNIIDDENLIQEKEKIKLEDVTRRQKEMEERNRRKKDQLSKAISERKRQANLETAKLKKIQVEFNKLDEDLSCDVSILRDKIDEACYMYSDAKKKFEHAEAMYIAAKFDLHKYTEKKEELTEHLYHLIQLNEERKAKKLEELMEKLDLENDEETPANQPDKCNTLLKSEEQSTLKAIEKLPEHSEKKENSDINSSKASSTTGDTDKNDVKS